MNPRQPFQAADKSYRFCWLALGMFPGLSGPHVDAPGWGKWPIFKWLPPEASVVTEEYGTSYIQSLVATDSTGFMRQAVEFGVVPQEVADEILLQYTYFLATGEVPWGSE